MSVPTLKLKTLFLCPDEIWTTPLEKNLGYCDSYGV